jgi:glutathione S-transferase
MKGVPMSLVLFGHPFSSYTQKVLIALFENATPHEFRSLDPGESPEHAAEWLRRWPLRKFPLLVDGERDDPMAALDVRFLDRFFDLHVMSPVQLAVDGALTGNPERRQEALARATDKLALAYAWLEGRLAGGAWAAGEAFTLADCAAAPALFYADWTYPIPEAYPVLRAYRARLLARPSVARAVDGGRPFRHYFPLGAPERD